MSPREFVARAERHGHFHRSPQRSGHDGRASNCSRLTGRKADTERPAESGLGNDPVVETSGGSRLGHGAVLNSPLRSQQSWSPPLSASVTTALIMLRSEVRFFLAPPVRSSRFELDHFHVWGYLHIPPMCIGPLDLDVCRMSPRRLRGRRPFLGLGGRPVRRKGPGLLLQSLDRTGITGDGCGNSRSPYPIFPLCDHNSASITSRRRYVTGRGGSSPARTEGF